jgi:hypothetical protein
MDEKEIPDIGPLSMRLSIDKRMPDILLLTSQSWSPESNALEIANEWMSSLIPSGAIRPMSFESSNEARPKNKFTGLPYCESSEDHADFYLARCLNGFSSWEQFYYHILGWRGQAGGEMTKNRNLCMAEKAEVINGGRFVYPLINTLRTIQGFSAWVSPDEVDKAATRMLTSSTGQALYSIDQSKFDTHISGEMFDVMRNIIEQWFISAVGEDIRVCFDVLKYVPLIVPWDLIYKTGGMPSGSVWTNVLDTLINLWIGFYITARLDLDLIDFEVMGDDSVFLWDEEPSLEELSNVADEIGFKLNPEKQHVAVNSLHFLQRMHIKEYVLDGLNRGIHSPFRSASGWWGMERWKSDWNAESVTGRLLMQTENCAYDTRFEEIVKYIMDGDKLLRVKDPVNILREMGDESSILDAIDRGGFPFNVADPSNADSWRVVQLVRQNQGVRG